MTNKMVTQFRYRHLPEGRRLCEGVSLVKRVHNLLGGVHRLATALQEVEEVSEEVREVKDEENGGQNRGRTAHIMSACGWDDTCTQLMT